MTMMIAIAGRADTGKTTLIEKLVPELKKRGYRVGTVKHATHGLAYDPEGKDSRRHMDAGADTVIVDAPEKLILFKSVPLESDVDRALAGLQPYFHDMDIVLAEGYKRSRLPKIEVYRDTGHGGPVCIDDDMLFAIVSETNFPHEIAQYHPEAINQIADAIEAEYRRRL